MKIIFKIHLKVLEAYLMFLVILSISFQEMKAQEFLYEENIKIPSANNLGYPVCDIIAADGKLFLYSSEGIIYYNPDIYPIVYGFIDFPGNYGKFNSPVSGSGGNDANLMTLNATDHLLYVVTPSLEIMKISTSNPGSSGTIIKDTPDSISHFQTLHGYNVIKYDSYHDRLYWLVEGRNEDNHTGDFHFRDTYLVVYKVNQNGDVLTYINSILTIGYNAGQYMETIYDVEFNETNDYFYVAKKRHLEVWQINESTSTITLVNYIKTLAGKFGKLLYVRYGNQIHKILAFPYRLPFTGCGYEYEPPMEADIRFFSIDGDNPFQVDSVLAPSKRINDAVYLSGYEDLVLCYAQDEFIQDYVVPQNSDIAYYHFDGDLFTHNYSWNLNTNGFPQYNEPEQLINRPNQMFANSFTSIIIGKTHEIVRIYKNGGNYTFNKLLSGESNCFSKTAKISFKDYTINPTLNGLVVYNESTSAINPTRIAYPVYNICANPVNGNLYFSNRLSSENGGFYIYNPVTKATLHINQYSPDACTKPIGDLIFNEFTGHYLVSENAPDAITNHVIVKVFDGESNALIDNIGVPGQYAKEMFISPQGWLYIMFDMHVGLNPKLLVLNANDYTENTIIELDMPQGYTDPFVSYTSEFLYNPKNRAVYLTISPNAILLEPYNPIINSMRDYSSSGSHDPNGLFLELSTNQIVRSFPMHFPGKMICPDCESPEKSANYYGKIFIKTNSLAIYPYDNPWPPQQIPGDPKYNEIIYSPYHDIVYGLRDEIDDQTGFNMDREINIYKINPDGTADWKFQYPGQAAAFFDNPYDTKLYLYVKIDDIKLGDTPTTLLQLDPNNPEFLNAYIDVENTAFYIEYDHNGDYRFHFYNMVQPYIDRYFNQIYLPNGCHANVSVASFKAEEPYYLGSGIKWLSFPRILRNSNEVEPAPNVLDRIKVPPYYDRGMMNNQVLNSTNLQYIEYNVANQEWDFSQGQLSTIHSSLGYKIDYLEPHAQRYITLEGEVWPSNENVTVYPRYENWVGYWLPETQSPFEAIPQKVLDQLISIKAQNWTCGKYWGSPGDGGSGSYWLCACHKGRVAFNYGDMAILKTIATTGTSTNFQWQRFGNPQDKESKPETEHFTYTEKSDYTAYFVELDTAELPQEIAAFINDTCVGATKVLPGETLVLVPGYKSESEGEVTFEQYFGPLKSKRITNRDYLVYNQFDGSKEKRILHSNDNLDYYRISFKNELSQELETKEEAWIKCLPNPAVEQIEIWYYIPSNGEIDIRLFDLFGRQVTTMKHGYALEGEYKMRYVLPQIYGHRLPDGVYYLILKSNANKVGAKVILIN